MTTAVAIDYTYDYRFPSQVANDRIALATTGGSVDADQFFHGVLRRPRVVGDLLTVLAKVVRTHFFDARPPDLDPVVTSSPAMLRFEGFSGCCGVYARVDLDERAFDSEVQTFGTTNVDFNEPMRRELSRLRDGERVCLSVGREAVELHRAGQTTIERKVELPVRWIKAFGEVQVYQSQLARQMEISGADFRRFLPTVPKHTRQALYAVPSGKSLRVSQRGGQNSIPINGAERLRVFQPLLPHAVRVLIWLEPESGTTGWQLETEIGSLTLLISPERYRGFSGEGQLLSRLATGDWQTVLPDIQPLLHWQTKIDPAELASRTGHRVAQVEAALAVLGSRGLAGFDAASGFYFHRRLPFDLERVEQLQPRLQNARKLLDAGDVNVLQHPNDQEWDVEVAGTGVAHHVRLRPDGDRCTCPWFSKHQGGRGPCKHVLAARMFVES